MSTLLTLALLLAPQIGLPSAPAAPAAPRVARLRSWDPVLSHTPNGRFQELELLTPDGPERFGLYVPRVPASLPCPVLVHFHAASGGNWELMLYANGLLQEADARGWYLVAPDQEVRNSAGRVEGRTYGNDEAQRRVQAVLDWALTTLPLDLERVYGYGFSMGGGDCLSYAAQHLDPARGAFAAIINHTGTLVLTEEWTRNSAARVPLQYAFNGTPLRERYAYQRAATIEFPSWSATSPSVFTGAGRHAAENLFFTPTRSWFHIADTTFLRAEEFMRALDTLVLDHGIEYQPTLPPPVSGGTIPAHAWEYLDPVVAFDWFAQHRLVVPTAGTLHFARDARYHDLGLTRKVTSDFGSLDFDVPRHSSTVRLASVSNVREVRIDAVRSQLDTQGSRVTFEVGRDLHPHPSLLGRPVIVEVTNLGFVPARVVQTNAPELPSVVRGNGSIRFVSTASGTTLDIIELRR